MRHTVISFGLILFSLLVLFRLAEYSRFQFGWNAEPWIVAFSIIFLCLGIFLTRKLQKEKIVEKHIVVEKEVTVEKELIVEKEVFPMKEEFTPDSKRLGELKISKREFEILQLISLGMSNQQIAASLFVSEHTVKKHITSLFIKLDVERRTEAVKRARDLSLVS